MEFFISLWKYLKVSAPYLLLGFAAAGLVHSFISVEFIKRKLGKKGFGSILKAAILGIPLPLCSCAVIPSSVTIKKAGATNAATSSFLIATPESGIDSIAMTYALLDIPMTIFRPLAAFCSAIFAGILQMIFNEKDYETNDESDKLIKSCSSEKKEIKTTSCCSSIKTEKKQEGQQKTKSCCSSKNVEKVESKKTSCCSSESSKKVKVDSCCSSKSDDMDKNKQNKISILGRLKKAFVFAFGSLINDLAYWMVIGLVLGAAIDYFVPTDMFATLNGTAGRFAILAIGIPFYICASASTPIAASLILKGMSPGTALLFLLVGPATNISNILVLQKYIGKKGILINIFSVGGIALLFSYIVDFAYSHFNLPLAFKIGEMHDHSGNANEIFSMESLLAIVLVILLLKGLYQSEIKGRFFVNKANNNGGGCCGK